jgi:hypothetical protein
MNSTYIGKYFTLLCFHLILSSAYITTLEVVLYNVDPVTKCMIHNSLIIAIANIDIGTPILNNLSTM